MTEYEPPGLHFADRLESAGWLVVPDAVPTPMLDAIVAQLDPALALRDRIRAANGVAGNNDGTLHHLLGDHPVFVQALDAIEPFSDRLAEFFSGKFILNSYGGVINRRDATAYVHNVHRDIRFASDGRRFMLNILVMLDDFTEANGATYLLSGSHREASKPEDERFRREAHRAKGRRGSMLFFDSRVWHATGLNTTAQPRRALTLTLTSPFFKQQLDYPRMLGPECAEGLSPFARQVVGFNARVPASLEEYYRPVAERFYQRGQDD